jgi:hypothetical protein
MSVRASEKEELPLKNVSSVEYFDSRVRQVCGGEINELEIGFASFDLFQKAFSPADRRAFHAVNCSSVP